MVVPWLAAILERVSPLLTVYVEPDAVEDEPDWDGAVDASDELEELPADEEGVDEELEPAELDDEPETGIVKVCPT